MKNTLSLNMIKSIKTIFIFFTVSLLITACSKKEESYSTTTSTTTSKQTINRTKTSFHLSLIDNKTNKKIKNKTVVLSRLISIDNKDNLKIQGEVKAKMNADGVAIFNLEELNFYFPGEKYVAFVDNNTSRCIDAPSINSQKSTSLLYGLFLANKFNCK